MKNVFVNMPYTPDYEDVFSAVLAALRKIAAENAIDFTVFRTIEELRHFIENEQDRIKVNSIYDLIKYTDVIITDISIQRSNMMYELGYAHALGKLTFALCQSVSSVPAELQHHLVIVYDRNQLNHQLTTPLKERMISILAGSGKIDNTAELHSRSSYFEGAKTKSVFQPPVVFISYHAADKEYADRLLTHLRGLQREGLCTLWSEQDIQGGEIREVKIKNALKEAKIAVILVSADYLDFELSSNDVLIQLLSDAQKDQKIIIPLRVTACLIDEDVAKLHPINPNTYLAKTPKPDQDEVYVAIAQRIKEILTGKKGNKTGKT